MMRGDSKLAVAVAAARDDVVELVALQDSHLIDVMVCNVARSLGDSRRCMTVYPVEVDTC